MKTFQNHIKTTIHSCILWEMKKGIISKEYTIFIFILFILYFLVKRPTRKGMTPIEQGPETVSERVREIESMIDDVVDEEPVSRPLRDWGYLEPTRKESTPQEPQGKIWGAAEPSQRKESDYTYEESTHSTISDYEAPPQRLPAYEYAPSTTSSESSMGSYERPPMRIGQPAYESPEPEEPTRREPSRQESEISAEFDWDDVPVMSTEHGSASLSGEWCVQCVRVIYVQP